MALKLPCTKFFQIFPNFFHGPFKVRSVSWVTVHRAIQSEILFLYYTFELNKTSIRTYNQIRMKFTSLQRREIFHLLFLEELLRCSDSRLYVVKGGINLRFFFNSPRFSEDMDIDVMGGAVGTLKKNGYKILANKSFLRVLKTYGIDDVLPNDPDRAKQTETTQRFRANLITTAGDILPTKIEFSRRKPVFEQGSTYDLVDPELARRYSRVSFHAQHYSGESAVMQKVEALALRTQTQARDVFDLYLLYSSGFIGSKTIAKICSSQLREQAVTALGSLTFEHFQGHVLEFLDPSVRQKNQDPQSWTRMKEQIADLIGYE